MSDARPKLRFALDHNFPAPVLHAFAVMMPDLDLVPVPDIDKALAKLEDWELFLALHRHEHHWDGLITNDDRLLFLPKEMAVLSQTRLTLVVAKGEGHNPIRAVGLLLSHLGFIWHHTLADRAQVWRLSVAQRPYEMPHDYLRRIAAKQGTTAEKLFEAHKLTSTGREQRRR